VLLASASSVFHKNARQRHPSPQHQSSRAVPDFHRKVVWVKVAQKAYPVCGRVGQDHPLPLRQDRSRGKDDVPVRLRQRRRAAVFVRHLHLAGSCKLGVEHLPRGPVNRAAVEKPLVVDRTGRNQRIAQNRDDRFGGVRYNTAYRRRQR